LPARQLNFRKSFIVLAWFTFTLIWHTHTDLFFKFIFNLVQVIWLEKLLGRLSISYEHLLKMLRGFLKNFVSWRTDYLLKKIFQLSIVTSLKQTCWRDAIQELGIVLCTFFQCFV
jgi:hypothetical protein